MTQIGKQFASLAESIIRIHGMNSKKMVQGYKIITEDSRNFWKEKQGSTTGAYDPELLDELVSMGYVRKFKGNPKTENRKRNWRYQYEATPVYFGLTAKGWEVAERYVVAAYGKEEFERITKKG